MRNMEEKKQISIGKKVLAIIAFWALMLLGGSLWGLWNLFSTDPNSIWWLLVQITASAFAVGIAGAAMDKIVNESANKFCMVNCIIGAAAVLCLTVIEALTGHGLVDVIRDLGGVIVALIWAKVFYDRQKEQNNKP